MVIFGRLEPILAVSKKINESFEAELVKKDNTLLNIVVTDCLFGYVVDMAIPHAEYVMAHDQINNLILKVAILISSFHLDLIHSLTKKETSFKYERDPIITEYVSKRLSTFQEKNRLADLKAILIKPTQRISKYPLLLSRIIEVRRNLNSSNLY